MEEIGGQLHDLYDLGYYHSNTGMESARVRLFFGRLTSIGTPNISEGIDRIQLVSTSEIDRMIRGGLITDGFTIATYARAKLHQLI
jgi:hypothetical protein